MIEVKELDIELFPVGEITPGWVHLVNNGIGAPIRVPVIVARGKTPGKTLGLTAAIHGNELNGIPVIQKIFEELRPKDLVGNIVGVLASNIPGVLRGERTFSDGADLNRIAPGNPDGNNSEVYIHRFLNRIIYKFDYLIDLHTASFGRVNSYYIRADMSDEVTARMAMLQAPDIILNIPASDKTIRGSAAEKGIKSITIELKDPHKFQFSVIDEAIFGIRNILYDFGMIPGEASCPVDDSILCDGSYWLYTDEGGILTIFPHTMDPIKKGQKLAQVRTIFGSIAKEYFAKDDGILIGKSINPINQTGSRIVHIGLNPRTIPCIL